MRSVLPLIMHTNMDSALEASEVAATMANRTVSKEKRDTAKANKSPTNRIHTHTHTHMYVLVSDLVECRVFYCRQIIRRKCLIICVMKAKRRKPSMGNYFKRWKYRFQYFFFLLSFQVNRTRMWTVTRQGIRSFGVALIIWSQRHKLFNRSTNTVLNRFR